MNEDLNIDESKGECLCDICEGRGSVKGDRGFYDMCWKCQGDGKLDWVSHITGKPTKPLHGTSFLNSSSGYCYAGYLHGTSGSPCNSYPNIQQSFNSAAKSIAKQIDEEIIDEIVKSAEQTPKIEKYYKWEDDKIDNRFFSKFMSYFNFKQELKS